MGLWSRFFGGSQSSFAPQAATQSAGGGNIIRTSADLAEMLRVGLQSASGVNVTPNNAMGIAAVYGCVRIISGAVATLPIAVKRRVDERTREDASDNALWKLLRRKPNRWQTPSQFRRMLQAHLLLRGKAYAMIVWSRGAPIELVPLNPDHVECTQLDDLSLVYDYTRRDGRKIRLAQSEVMHLVGLTLDGVNGVSVLTYARESLGESIASAAHGAAMFRNGARISNVLKHPGKLGSEALKFLRESLDAYRSGGESEGKALILEEGMDVSPLQMTSVDAQWIEARKFTRTDIEMFFGVPGSMLGDTEKTTSWGSGVEQQSIGFVTYTLEDWLTTWEETIARDLIGDRDDLYVRFNRAALVKGDIKTRWAAYVQALQWGVMSPNEVRALEDMNPRADGDVFYPPPNTAGDPSKGSGDEPAQDA
jgi:HK97 family phage portal protein